MHARLNLDRRALRLLGSLGDGRGARRLRPLRRLAVDAKPNRRLPQRFAAAELGTDISDRTAARAGRHSMNRTGLLIALALAAAIGLLFGIFPKLDLFLESLFFDPASVSEGGFWALYVPVLNRARDLARLITGLLVAPAILAVVGKLIAPRRRMLVPGRAAVLLIATLALGPGLLTNSVLKQHWGRPRPIDVSDFAGDQRFVPWWDPRGECPSNCSFVAGEPSGAFWTLAPAALAPPAWRGAATAAALTFGAGVGLIRMSGGGHFFTDEVFGPGANRR